MDNSQFFSVFNFDLTSSSQFDEDLQNANKDELVCLFLWGHDCPNCEISKKVLVDRQLEVKQLNMKWLHANVYEDFEIARRFGLFGIPVFLFFKNGKRLGKISPFPGFDPFYQAVQSLIE